MRETPVMVDLTHAKTERSKVRGLSEVITKARDPNTFNKDVQN